MYSSFGNKYYVTRLDLIAFVIYKIIAVTLFKKVYLKDVVDDYNAIDEVNGKKHRYGCSGIDGITFAPIPSENGEKYVYVAYGIYSHFHTTFETDALVNSIRAMSDRGVPFVISKIRSEENADYSLTALNDCGASWLFGDFKGNGDAANYLFSADISPADLTYDSYDEIGEKWSKPLSTKNFSENKELAKTLKEAFRYGGISAPKNKLKVKVKFGFNMVKGMNK
jgi:hypothetical protein